MDELKGNLKEGAGKLTGNTNMEAEGAAERDSARAERNVKGAANEVKGNLKEGVGKLTGDESTRAEGVADQLKGDAQRTG
jgi:uncharacterized protein YjbJ (UPF0337 family)